MTKILYMDNIEDNYVKEFKAKVTKSKKNYISLDQTAFYPKGGGQPSDTGIIKWDDKTSRVKKVVKKGSTIKHILEGEKPETGKQLQAKIDWDKRYKHMKMHTAQHILSGIVYDKYGARTVGNQIHEDYSRVDFKPTRFTENELEHIREKFNQIVENSNPVRIYKEKREQLEQKVNPERCNLDLIPKSVQNLRIVEIQNFDICPCAGTHVKNTDEIPKISEIKRETKGKDTDRIIYSF
ncbi:MAG: alanyl-tRNA editing protein [Candidatus Thermoplasmatota archaeon]